MVLDGESLTPEAVVGVARGGFPVSLSIEGRERNETAYRTTLRLLEGEDPVYGMNTGVRALKTVPIPPELVEDHESSGFCGSTPSGPATRCLSRSRARCSRC